MSTSDPIPNSAIISDNDAQSSAGTPSSDASGIEESLSDLAKSALALPHLPATVGGSINPYAFCLGAAAIFLLSRLTSYLTPFKLYFSFQSFLFTTDDRVKWISLGMKLAIPVIVGFLLFYLPYQWLLLNGHKNAAHPIVRYLHLQADLSARFCAFFVALLMAWPFIIYWDLMVPPNINQYKTAFLFIYFLYFVSYSYFASLGVLIAKWFAGEKLTSFQQLEITKTLTFMEGIRTSAMGVLTSAFATYLSTHLVGAS